MPRKPKPAIDTGIQVVIRGPRPPKSAFGTLCERFKGFLDRDEKPLTRDDIIGMLRFEAENENISGKKTSISKWIDEYDCNVNKEMNYEAYCNLAGVTPNEFYGIVTGLYVQACNGHARLTLAGRITNVMDATLDFAENNPENHADRNLAMKMAEMPGTQPSSININQNVQVNSLSAAGVPRFETSQAAMTKKVLAATEAKMLNPAGAVIEVVAEREAVEVERD